jgi:hypothetical protein
VLDVIAINRGLGRLVDRNNVKQLAPTARTAGWIGRDAATLVPAGRVLDVLLIKKARRVATPPDETHSYVRVEFGLC